MSTYPKHGLGGREGAEEPVRLTVDARGEEQGVGRSGTGTIAERQAPQAVDLDRFALEPRELAGGREAVRATLREPEGVDSAVAEVADQHVATKLPKVTGCHSNSPGRVERASRRDALEQFTAGVEHVDEAVARASDVIVLGGVLLGVGDVQKALRGARRRDALDPEWSVSFGSLGSVNAPEARVT
jgi:hypothetical protein